MFSREKLLKYIDYFSSDKIKFCSWVTSESREANTITMGYPHYDEGLDRFVRDFYESDMIDGNYVVNISKYHDRTSTPEEFIKVTDMNTLKTILTYYIRSERFCDGSWADAIDKRIFLSVLLRLKELQGE